MKHILLFTSLVFCLNGFGQISITLQDMPAAGDTLRYSNAQITPAFLSAYQSSGPNTTWNFSNLNQQSQDVEKYELSSQTNYSVTDAIARKFADSLDLGGVVFTNVYDFIDTASTSYDMIGRGVTYSGLPILINYTNPDEIYQFPLEYSDRDSSSFEAVFSNIFLQVYYQSKGYRINNVDGYGQITTPYGSFDAIRVVSDIVQSDTISYDTINYRLDTHFREYKWLAKGIKYPILQVLGTVNSGIFAPLSVTYRDSIHPGSVNIAESSMHNSDIQISPNPVTNNHINVKLPLTEKTSYQVELLDISGKKVWASPKNIVASDKHGYEMQIPLNLTNGVYFVKFITEQKVLTKKLIVAR